MNLNMFSRTQNKRGSSTNLKHVTMKEKRKRFIGEPKKVRFVNKHFLIIFIFLNSKRSYESQILKFIHWWVKKKSFINEPNMFVYTYYAEKEFINEPKSCLCELWRKFINEPIACLFLPFVFVIHIIAKRGS